MNVLFRFNAFMVNVINFMYAKYELSAQNDVKFGFENIECESEFLLTFNNFVQTISLCGNTTKLH